MTSPQNATTEPAPERVVVIGSGIAGTEAALTLAIGLPSSDVTLIGASDTVSILPDLVYMPFGVEPGRIDVPLTELREHGVTYVQAHVDHVDATRRVVLTSAGERPFDVLVASPGAVPRERDPLAFRSMDDALRIREQLRAIERSNDRASIVVLADGDDSWTAPACELAMLFGTWIRSSELARRVDVILATADSAAFEWFGHEATTAVDAGLRRARVKVATGVPPGRFDELVGDLNIRVGPLQARRIDGLPGHAPHGWYRTSSDFEVAPGVFVIGDAIDLPYRAGFATAWQARRVLAILGGDMGNLGLTLDGIPSTAVEYQMDLADSVLKARLDHADRLAHPFLGHDATITTVPGARPDKLAGLVLHDRVIRRHASDHDAPLAFRDALRDRTAVRH